ncbi:MAG: hypothetical protein QM610_08595 [Chitinophagaceae bacterium]
MPYHIVKVNDKKLLKAFIDFPHELYKNDANYVPELFVAQRDLLTPGKNPFFETGRMQLFLAYDQANHHIVGRIAGIYNANYIKFIEKDDGFFGFFDCINDQSVADILLDAAYGWVREQGVKGNIVGPANPTSNDSWGLLIDGFDTPSMVMMPYNFPYYRTLLENYGMQKEVDLLAYIYTKADYNGEKVRRLSLFLEERLKKRNIIIRKIDLKKNFHHEVERIRKVYNKAWDKNLGSVPLTENEFNHVAKDLKMIVNLDFCYVAEMDDEIIGICIAIPNVNEIQQKIKRGRLFPTGLFKLLTQMKNLTSFRIMILGVLEEYRKLGIEACFYAHLMRSADKYPKINRIEASWILEQNMMMNRAVLDIGGKVYKTYRVYKKAIGN